MRQINSLQETHTYKATTDSDRVADGITVHGKKNRIGEPFSNSIENRSCSIFTNAPE